MARAIIKSTGINSVSIEYTNPLTAEREHFEVYAPHSGGYVRFSHNDNQVCDALSTRGDTLLFKGDPEQFVEFIRGEYKKMMRELKSIYE